MDKGIDWFADLLVLLGGLNWGLFAFGYNVVNMIFGSFATVEKIVYILIGLSALYMIYNRTKS